MRLIRDGKKGEMGAWRWGKREIIYLLLHCHHQRMTSALRWAAMRAILMFHNSEGQSHKTVYLHIDHNLWSERRAEADSNRGLSAYQPHALPLGYTGSRSVYSALVCICMPYTTVLSCFALSQRRLRGFGWTAIGVWTTYLNFLKSLNRSVTIGPCKTMIFVDLIFLI